MSNVKIQHETRFERVPYSENVFSVITQPDYLQSNVNVFDLKLSVAEENLHTTS